MCGYTEAVQSYVRAVSLATGRTDLERTTLLALHGVADGKCHRALKSSRFWCPACMEEAVRGDQAHYDRLLWCLRAVGRCPLHKVMLASCCPSCGIVQRHYSASGSTLLCWKCGRLLLTRPKQWEVRQEALFGERDCCELVSAIASGRLERGQPGAFKTFSDEVVATVEPYIFRKAIYTERVELRDFDVRFWKTRGPPHLETMLRRCHATGVSIVAVLEDPLGAARHASQLELTRHNVPHTTKPRRSQELGILIRNELIRLLALPSTEHLPSLGSFACEYGVSVGYIRYREPELVKNLCNRLRTQGISENRRASSAAARWLRSADMIPVFEQLGRSQRRLISHVAARFGTSINVARRAVSGATSARNRAEREADCHPRKQRKGHHSKRMSEFRLLLLTLLGSSNHEMSTHEIEAALGATTCKTHKALVYLERTGWIRRKIARTFRVTGPRPTYVVLTESGRSVLSAWGSTRRRLR